jgi:hypothetical protein
MHSEHHIDAFDLPSFFKLHDLDNDGHWTVAEIQAVYGLNPDAAHSHGHAHGHQGGKPGGSQEREMAEKAKIVSDKVLEVMDMNRDGECCRILEVSCLAAEHGPGQDGGQVY